MTMRVVLLVGGTLLAAIAGALLAAVILLAFTLEDQGARLDRAEGARERLIADEQQICAVLRFSPDPEQSRQIALLASAAGDRRLAEDARRSARQDRLPNRCK